MVWFHTVREVLRSGQAIAVRARWLPPVALVTLLCGCQHLIDQTDRQVLAAIEKRQQEALGQQTPLRIPVERELLQEAPSAAYRYNPRPVSPEVPEDFRVPAAPTPQPPTQDTTPEAATQANTTMLIGEETAQAATTLPSLEPLAAAVPQSQATQPTQPSRRRFTLTDALAYAQRHQRAFQTAKEDLYLSALALTLERHLWTPTFAANLKTVYGNFGEITDFDQAMRFVADLSVAQRLPYGGTFTAKAISTLIRDVKQTITASEGSQVALELNVPFLRGAGHVAREQLIQLERELTYAVRTFERFRRRQLVEVAREYFDLLRAKQQVLDNELSLQRVRMDFERAREFQERELGSLLDTQRAEQQYLFAENRLEDSRESFRAAADRFKLLIGMPVDEPLTMEDLEDIESIEAQIAEGRYPLLLRPPAVDDEERALAVAQANRLDLLNLADQIDDARRGVAVARNALLPDLNLVSTVTWDTDPAHYRLADFSFERTTWRSELLLSLPLERTAERNRYRAALIDVQRAQRQYQESLESIRAEVRAAARRIALEERSLEIQRQNVKVAERRLQYARMQYDEGEIGNRDLFEAESEWTDARNRLNLAKTAGWSAILQFRLATETLRIDENGTQHAPENNGDATGL